LSQAIKFARLRGSLPPMKRGVRNEYAAAGCLSPFAARIP